MGTLGGKIGLVAGIITGAVTILPIIRLVLGDCFFEQGCGDNETVWVIASVLGAALIALAVGVAVRLVANRTLDVDR